MEIMVSIIVPVYNVEIYINKCLDSLANQTYKNIEIIVINDGSTDSSGDICEKRAEKDHFVYISKANEGLGATRNLGMRIAKGNYILFVDSDDWLASDAVEKMVSSIKEGEAPDIVALSRYFEFNDRTKELKEKRQNETIGTVSICEELQRRMYLLYGFVVVWGKLFRRSFLLHNEILMPSIPHEDNAVFPEIVFRSNYIQFCDKPLYYYRINRNGNIQSKISHYQYMSDACDNFLKYFIEHDMLEKHYAAIKHYVETRLKWSYDLYCQQESDTDRHIAVFNKFTELRNKYFKEKRAFWEYRFGLFGSFGSRWVIQSLGTDIQQLIYHTPFSSLIAQMKNGESADCKIYNKNEFRREKIKNDIEGTLCKLLEENLKPVDFFFIDFLEERYDVAELDDGNFITLSEAFSDSIIEGLNIKRVVKAGTEEYLKIWKKSCKKLAELLKEKYTYNQIILIKSRLATCYQIKERFVEYLDRETLKEKNFMIEQMEKYFFDLMDHKIQMYAYPKKIYTEEHFRMGKEPQYLGNSFYWGIRMHISACFDCIAH